MAHWQDCVITDTGTEMLNELMAGRRLTITGAFGCTGKVAKEELKGLTALAGEPHRLDLMDVENGLQGKTVKIQINNTGLEESWQLDRIGIYARVDEEEERLLLVMQDERGVEIPAQAENPGFILEIYCDMEISGDVEIRVDLTGSGAVVTPPYLAEVMKSHEESSDPHPALSARMEEISREMQAAVPVTGTSPPTPETAAEPGRHFFFEGQEYVCTGQDEEGGYIWRGIPYLNENGMIPSAQVQGTGGNALDATLLEVGSELEALRQNSGSFILTKQPVPPAQRKPKTLYGLILQNYGGES